VTHDVAAVAAVVTAFQPGDELAGLVRALRPQVSRVVVVDDGSDPRADPALEAARAAGALVVRHGGNLGIAAALNTGIRAARTDAVGGLAHVVTFDQDSRVSPDFVPALVATARDATAAGVRVGLVAPAEVEGLPSPVTGYDRGFLLAATPIQSGLLIPLTTLDAVGPFTERLFIDCVDTDYALRVADTGRAVVLASGTVLGHDLGRRHTPRVLGRPLRVGGEPLSLVHSAPFRYYYLVRNRVLMNRVHGRRHRAWAVHETVADLRHAVIVTLLVPGRRERLAAMRVGLGDGWKGRSGRIPRDLEERLAAARP
jgi:rhamnosyltransferase